MPTLQMHMAETDTPTPQTAERKLLIAVLIQAARDLTPTPPPQSREEACRFWRGERGELGWLWEQLDLDAHQVHRRILAMYPEVAQPRQLELGLEVPV